MGLHSWHSLDSRSDTASLDTKEVKEMIEMCAFYTTCPNFKPLCLHDLKASLKCHSRRVDCPLYEPSGEGGQKKERERLIKKKNEFNIKS